MKHNGSGAARDFKARTIHELVAETADLYPERRAITFKDSDGQFRSITYGQLRDLVDRVALALRDQGITKGDRIAICSSNGPDWVIADLAILKLGAIVVPIYRTLSPSLIAHMLRDSGSRLIFVGDAELFATIETIRRELPDLATIVVFDPTGLEDSARFLRFSVLKAGGAKASCETAPERIDPDAVATVVYTSGTMGEPKGVMLSHANIVSNALANIERFHTVPDDVFLSFLPLCHMLERTCGCYTMLFTGATIAYAGTVATVADDVRVVRPTILIVVPRIIEKIFQAVERKVMEGSAFRRKLTLAALRTLNRRVNLEYRGLPVPVLLRLKCIFYDRYVASRFRAIAGGRLRFIVSGGAPLDRTLGKIMLVMGFNIVQGYGLTETSPAVATNLLDDNRLGTVGKPYPGVEVRFGDNDEILVRGPNLMRGYYNKPQDTAAAIDGDGWFHTGDQGRFDERGNLVITGRIKEIIVTSYGKNVAPVPIETEIARSPYIDQVMLCGDRRKFITALVVPARAAILEFAEEIRAGAAAYDDLLRDARIRSLIADEIASATSACAPYEKVKDFILLAEGFTTENDLLTPTLKPRRPRIEAKYASEIASMYTQA